MAYDPPNENDFTVQVNRGEIPRYAHAFTIGYKENLGTSYETVWNSPGMMVDPTAPEVYEVVSTSANDTLAGTGARTVRISSLDENGEWQEIFVDLNGTTAVQVSGLHSFPRSFLVSDAGSSNGCEGDITLRAQTTNYVRNTINVGDNAALSSNYKVPTNREFHLIGLDYHTGGVSKVVNLKSQIKFPGSSIWLTTSNLPMLNQSFEKTFKISAKYDAGTQIRYIARTDGGSSGDKDLSVIVLGYEYDTSV